MITKSIKDLLGAELAGQVEEALKGKGKDGVDVDLVVGNDNTFIPAETHEMAKSQAEKAEATLKAVAESLKGLGGTGNSENLAADVLKVQGDMAALQDTHAKDMALLQKTTALKLALGASVHDPDDVISRLDLDKIELDEKGAPKGDLAELIKPIKESKPYLFKEAANQLKGAVPGAVTDGADGDETEAAQFDAAFDLKGE